MTTIRASIQVALPQAQAFDEFTRGLDRWWPPAGRKPGAPQVFIEPGVGGRWFERGANGADSPWGQVLAWVPPQRVLLTWQIAANGDFDPNLQTELELRFEPLSAKASRVSLVTLEHRHLERYAGAADAQEVTLSSAVGWVGILACYARHCERVRLGPHSETSASTPAPSSEDDDA
jgi:uncharacterized protein YndB with AHSA1/START domain